jgi:hypothetical protein
VARNPAGTIGVNGLSVLSGHLPARLARRHAPKGRGGPTIISARLDPDWQSDDEMVAILIADTPYNEGGARCVVDVSADARQICQT